LLATARKSESRSTGVLIDRHTMDIYDRGL
jgi:hypothetical protein